VIDVSQSIERSAEAEAFQAVEDAVANLSRGDSVAVIPITGDAGVQLQGRILRFRVPTVREAYDQDRKKFARATRLALETSKTDAIRNPGDMTDILGTLRVAGEEFALDPPATERYLVVLSDFIQEDQTNNFTTGPMLANAPCAISLAHRLSEGERFPQLTRVFLGSLRSTTLSQLSRDRRDAIGAFWREYFGAAGCQPLSVVDGPGVLVDFLRSPQRPCENTAR
jgi:hypothetical protein